MITLFSRTTIAILLAVSLAAGIVFLISQRADFSHDGKSGQLKQISVASHDWQPHMRRLAGDGNTGKRDGAALQARFDDPFGIVQDTRGNFYLTDAGQNNLIRQISPAGQVSTFAGSTEGFTDGERLQAAFNTPSGITIDADGNLYVADTGNHAIRKISTQGQVSTLAGNGQPGDRDGPAQQAQFRSPVALTVDNRGNVYVADTYNDKIRRISRDGIVTTVAGGQHHGYRDGRGADALFDTPGGIAINAQGELLIADTRNHAIRQISANGDVRTLYQSAKEDRQSPLRRPVGIAAAPGGLIYVGDTGHGGILQLQPDGKLRDITGSDADLATATEQTLRIGIPAGLCISAAGELIVADSQISVIYRLSTATAENPQENLLPSPVADIKTVFPEKSLPWPLKPFQAAHEIVGTMGEVRGKTGADARDHFHSGIDIQGNLGSGVYAVHDEKIRELVSAWGYNTLNEGMKIDQFSYIHMKVGRDSQDQLLDSQRFQILSDEQGKADAVRIPRGTRFRTGDLLGSINRMYHVHLNYSLNGRQFNPLALPFPGIRDNMPPVIEQIQVYGAHGEAFKKQAGRILLPSATEPLRLVVEAYDQSDSNLARRRLGIYRLGYQLLRADEQPLPGYAEPVINIEFNQLPPDSESVKVAYAEGSGITVHGNATTRFLYQLNNLVKDGYAKEAQLMLPALPAGDYIIRIMAEDFHGNRASRHRDLAIRIP